MLIDRLILISSNLRKPPPQTRGANKLEAQQCHERTEFRLKRRYSILEMIGNNVLAVNRGSSNGLASFY